MKRNRLIFSLICASVAGAFAACGGVDSDLLSGGDDGGPGTSDGSFSDSGSGRDASSGRDSATSSDGSSGGDASPSDGGIIIKPKKDAGIIQCGNNGSTGGVGGAPVDCNVADPVCCATQYPFDTVNPLTFECTANAPDCTDYDSGSIPIECRSNDDCPGASQCCGHEMTFDTTGTPITIYESVRCAATCPLLLPDAGETAYRLFCNPAAAVNVCPTGESCLQSTLLPGFNVCGMP
jgi:hypothetical protein